MRPCGSLDPPPPRPLEPLRRWRGAAWTGEAEGSPAMVWAWACRPPAPAAALCLLNRLRSAFNCVARTVPRSNSTCAPHPPTHVHTPRNPTDQSSTATAATMHETRRSVAMKARVERWHTPPQVQDPAHVRSPASPSPRRGPGIARPLASQPHEAGARTWTVPRSHVYSTWPTNT